MSLLTIQDVIGAPADSWISPGFRAYVSDVKQIPTKKGGIFHKAVLVDAVGGPQVGMAMFTVPRFKAGDTIEVTGQGVKRKADFGGVAEIGVSDKTAISVSVGAQRVMQAAQGAIDAQKTNGSPPNHSPVHGASVGAAVKLAFDALVSDLEKGSVAATIKLPAFYKEVWEVASDIIRVHVALESGKLAKPAAERMGPDPRKQSSAPAKTVSQPHPHHVPISGGSPESDFDGEPSDPPF